MILLKQVFIAKASVDCHEQMVLNWQGSYQTLSEWNRHIMRPSSALREDESQQVKLLSEACVKSVSNNNSLTRNYLTLRIPFKQTILGLGFSSGTHILYLALLSWTIISVKARSGVY